MEAEELFGLHADENASIARFETDLRQSGQRLIDDGANFVTARQWRYGAAFAIGKNSGDALRLGGLQFAACDAAHRDKINGVVERQLSQQYAQMILKQYTTVDKGDKQINNFLATAKLVRYEWQTVLKKDYSDRYYYASEEKEFNEWEKDVTINDPTKFNFMVSKSRRYELRISKKGSSDYEKNNFYAYGWGA